MPLIRAGDRHGADVEKAIGVSFRFVCLFIFLFLFSLKICEIREQIGQEGNACKMGESLGAREQVGKGSCLDSSSSRIRGRNLNLNSQISSCFVAIHERRPKLVYSPGMVNPNLNYNLSIRESTCEGNVMNSPSIEKSLMRTTVLT